MRSRFSRVRRVLSGEYLVAGFSAATFATGAHADPTPFVTLNYGDASTFLTGIRGGNIVGNYVIPGTTDTGGLYYNLATGAWSPLPVATENGVNFPGAIGSSPYGPNFGTPSGILRAVGSYQTEASAPYDLSYLFDAAAAPGQQITDLAYPSTPGAETLFTIAHSTFGHLVVGDYDTRLATGNAFIYDIRTGTYVTNNIPGAISSTAYGIYGDKIAGGYAEAKIGGGLGPEHGYIYDLTTGTHRTYDHPGAVATHFEGITGAGRAGEYNIVANWITADGKVHPAVMHVDALGIATWYEIDIPGDVVSSNSAYGNKVVGIYVANGQTNGYVATIDGMYNPITNTGPLTSSADNAAALSGTQGDDIVNSGAVEVTGTGGVGIRGETYGVLSNSGTINATGLVGAAAELHGLYGSLLNSGTLHAEIVADALRTGPDSYGTIIVNTGIIDGRIAATAGPEKRFENSGWIGVNGTGLPIQDLLSGTFVQTAAGTFAVRVTDTGNDALEVTGTARLAGTLAARFQTEDYLKSYAVFAATEELAGTFDTLAVDGLPALFATALGYTPSLVTLNVASGLGDLPGTTSNERAVGAAIDGIINGTSGEALGELPAALSPLYALDAGQLPGALAALSGEAYASEQSVLIGDSLYGREAILGRLRQDAYAGQAGTAGTLAQGGPAVAAADANHTIWGEAFGSWMNLDGDGNTADVSESYGGIIAGGDIKLDNWLVGAAIGYSQSDADSDALAGSINADSVQLALYAGTHSGPWNVSLGVSYAFNSIDAQRTVAYPGYAEHANADYDGQTAQAFAEVGYVIALQQMALEPFAGLAWVNLHTDGFAEDGASAGLSGSSTSSNVGYSTLGLRAATVLPLSDGVNLQPYASVAWQYAFGDTTPSGEFGFIASPGANFTISGVPLAENTARLEIGADLLLSPQSRLGISYMGQFGDNASSNAVQANLAWSF
jgi:outer membrane autotransporter protein